MVAVLIGVGFTSALIAAPADAATPATSQCAGLLGCVTTTLTGTLNSTVTDVVAPVTHVVPTVVNTVPQVVNAVLPAKKSSGGSNSGKGHGKGGSKGGGKVTTHKNESVHKKSVTVAPKKPTTQPRKPATSHVSAVSPVTIPHAQGSAAASSPGPVTQIIQDVAHAAAQVVSLFGWNLLALIPMSGIAFVISRRLGLARRRSVSGLL